MNNLNLVKENARKRPAEAGLGRQGALRKRKGEVHEQNGHKFIQQIFYQVMKCSYCEELFANEGYQCEGILIAFPFFFFKKKFF